MNRTSLSNVGTVNKEAVSIATKYKECCCCCF